MTDDGRTADVHASVCHATEFGCVSATGSRYTDAIRSLIERDLFAEGGGVPVPRLAPSTWVGGAITDDGCHALYPANACCSALKGIRYQNP